MQVTLLGLGEEAGAHEEHHAHGHLCAHQGGAQTAASAQQAPVAFERRCEIHLDGFQRGRKAGEDSTEQHDGGDVEEDAPIGIHWVIRGARRQVTEERLRQVANEVNAGGSGERRHDQTLCDQHSDQADAGRSEREADGDFAAARGRSREQQGGHIRAGDEQHQGERAEEKGEQEEVARGGVHFEFGEPGAIGSNDGRGASGMELIFLPLQDIELGTHLTAREPRCDASGQVEPQHGAIGEAVAAGIHVGQ